MRLLLALMAVLALLAGASVATAAPAERCQMSAGAAVVAVMDSSASRQAPCCNQGLAHDVAGQMCAHGCAVTCTVAQAMPVSQKLAPVDVRRPTGFGPPASSAPYEPPGLKRPPKSMV